MVIKRIIDNIVLVTFYVFLIWMAYQIILKITGHSPSVETVLSTAIVMIISFLLLSTLKVGEFMGETRSFMGNTKESFRRMKKDLDKLTDKLKK